MSMKRYYLFVFILNLVSCSKVSVPSENVNTEPPQKVNAQVELIKKNIQSFPSETQLSMAIIKDGKVFFRGIERSSEGIHSVNNEDRVFEIGSITKVFTACLLAHFVNDGKLALNDPINGDLGKENMLKEEITFQQLSNHSSGLPRLPSNLDLMKADPNNPYKEYGEFQLQEYFQKHVKLNQQPNKKYEYSNLGTGTLGYLLTQKANSTYENLLSTHITSKYGMTSTTTSRHKLDHELLIAGLNNQGKEISHWDLNVLVGAGGILSSVRDMSKFALAHFDANNKDLQLTHPATFKINENLDSGLGWMIVNTKNGSKWLVHNGGTGGFSSSMILDTAQKNGCSIFFPSIKNSFWQ